ncbi:serine carboxypeptidase-like 19 [Quercus suber]|uniref:Serine carboxypeptidase-like 19 n=1 Tax=Quercus suber TaxID=58331 RepID=A0AAW0M8I7_QUESU
MDDVQLFYYFVESQREPSSDPLLVWLTGGPGCSSFYPFFIGNVVDRSPEFAENHLYLGGGSYTGILIPVTVQKMYDDYCSQLASIHTCVGPLSFHYIFSERELPTLHLNSDTWTKRLNILYIDAPVGSGFSYSKSLEGYYSDDQKTVANLYNFLQRLTKLGTSHTLISKIRGYVLASPKSDSYLDANSKVPAAHRLTLISDELYKVITVCLLVT